MSYQSDIYDAVVAGATLSPLIGNRFFWDIADGDAVAPYIVAQTVSTLSENTNDGNRSLSFPLIQFSIWAKTKVAVIAITAALKTDIEGITLPGSSSTSLSFSSSNSTYETDTKLYGELVEYRGHSLTN